MSIPQVLDDETLHYVYGLGRIAQVAGNGDTFYYLADGLGSTMALVDDTGAAINTYDYDVFGAVLASTGSQANAFKFTGEQADSSTGLEYLRARYYDMETGRFVSKDPMLERPEWNGHPYAMANSSVTNYSDPSGLDPDDSDRPKPVPGPVAMSVEDDQICDEGFQRCLEDLVPLIHQQYPRIAWTTLNRVCSDMRRQCLNRVLEGKPAEFKNEDVWERVRLISQSSKEGSIVSTIKGLLRAPFTGSGGLLDSHSKEGSQFGCR
ncbi:MAG TPA: RHS repeat-associated core domain-containing protein [Dehalococcoidia bacterium]|nr:RHS repeat-associated core domain-containing protein [Dehalococcoidia bacterium]